MAKRKAEPLVTLFSEYYFRLIGSWKDIPVYGEELRKIRLQYWKLLVEPMPDRLSTAKILKEKEGVCLSDRSKSLWEGDDMWVRSQGEDISNDIEI